MTQSAKKAGRPLGAQIQVRSHIINLMYRQKEESVKLPPYEELARELGVARSTLQIAVKQLIEEGFLVSKPGIGTFSNPGRRVAPKASYLGLPKMIGIIVWDGKVVYYQYFNWGLVSGMGAALANRGVNVQFLGLNTYTDETMFREIRSAHLDGLIWLMPTAERFALIRKLAAVQPVTAVGVEIEGVPCFRFNTEKEGYEMAKQLLGRGRRSFAFSPYFAGITLKMQGVERAFREVGLTLDRRQVYTCPERFEDSFEENFHAGIRPDVFCYHPEEARFLLPFLQEHGLEMPNQCLPMVFYCRNPDSDLPVAIETVDVDALCRAAAKQLIRQVESQDCLDAPAVTMIDGIGLSFPEEIKQ